MKQKVLRAYAAAMTALVTGGAVSAYYWIFTQKDVLEIMIVAYAAAVFSFFGVFALFEDKEEAEEE